MGILQCSTGRGMAPPAPEACFAILRAKPSRPRFWFCKILKPAFKCSVEFLWAAKSSFWGSELLHQVLSLGSGLLSQSLKGESCPWSFPLPSLAFGSFFARTPWVCSWDLEAQAPYLWPSTTAGGYSVSPRVFLCTGRREMRCWAQIANVCACVYPCLLWVRIDQGSTKDGCVHTVSSGTSHGAMLQNVALTNSSREEVQALHLPALMCSSS